MKWYEICIHTTHEAQEPITQRLLDHGISGVMIKDPLDLVRKREAPFGEIYELDPKMYPSDGIYLTFYMPATEDFVEKLAKIKQSIRELKDLDIDLGHHIYMIHPIEETDWENEWKKYYKPVAITDRITIVPTWEEYEAKQNELIIKLDPGMAFGTGTHPTTMQSVRALEKYVQADDIVIDVGCGSGILSITACLLGAKQTYAYDIDPVAISSTEQNADMNGVSDKVIATKNHLLEGVTIRPDVIVANILAEIIVQCVDDAWRLLKDDGIFITAGIIKKQQDLVTERLLNAGFTILETQEHHHWVSIVAKK